jgi:hypothetical protein
VASALIKVEDIDGAVDIQVKFHPEIDNESAAHRMVEEFVKFANLVPHDESASAPDIPD